MNEGGNGIHSAIQHNNNVRMCTVRSYSVLKMLMKHAQRNKNKKQTIGEKITTDECWWNQIDNILILIHPNTQSHKHIEMRCIGASIEHTTHAPHLGVLISNERRERERANNKRLI